MNSIIIDKIKSDAILSKIIDNFDNEIFLVGGTVRDYYMGLESVDRDIIVMDENARTFSLKLADICKLHLSKSDLKKIIFTD